ncbi:hypothetical protein Hanom_Chr11g01046451 [Helianthus anomalus]
MIKPLDTWYLKEYANYMHNSVYVQQFLDKLQMQQPLVCPTLNVYNMSLTS